MEKKTNDEFNELLEKVGMEGKFQKRYNIIFILMFILTMGIPVFNIILAVTLPNHWCHVPGRNGTNLTLEEWKQLTIPKNEDKGAGQEYSKCSMYNVSIPADIQTLRDFRENNRNDTVPCQYGWEYNKKWYSQTAPTEENWVCEKEFYVPTSLLMARVGIIVGTLVFGHLGDTMGRRPVLFLGVMTLIVGRCLVTFTSGYYAVFLFANILCCLPISVVFQSPLIIGMEISSARKRALITMLQCVGYTTGMCLLPMIAWATGGHWKWFMILSTLPCAAIFLAVRSFPESPRWLAGKGQSEKCLKVLKNIAKQNGTSVPEDALSVLDKMAGQKRKMYGMASLFSNRTLARNTIITSMCMSFTQVLYQTMILSVAAMSGNPFLNFFLQAIVELPGFFIGRYVSDRFGRRWSETCAFFIAAIFQFACIIVVPYANMLWLLITMVLVIKFCSTVASYVSYLQCMEIYPTCLRQTGTSLGFFLSNAIGGLGPYIVYLGSVADVRYPYAILCAMCLGGMICASLLPETLNKKLPETVEDAAIFGTDQKFWSFPQRTTNKDYQSAPTK